MNFVVAWGDSTFSKYRKVASFHDVIRSNGRDLFPSLFYSNSMYMNLELANAVRSWLRESNHQRISSITRPPLELDKDQRRLATENEPLRRRVRGPAGSGKSQTLAACASIYSGRFESVLVLTFNITLWHYLRELAFRHVNPEARPHTHVEWNHFHQWCIDRCLEAGLSSEYYSLWDNNPTDVLDCLLPDLTRKALTISGKRYDAIAIDEGQDFRFEWWKLIRTSLKGSGGRVFFVADRTQDLYERSDSWVQAESEDLVYGRNWTEDDNLGGTGFRTPWFALTKSYRLPRPVIRSLRQFAIDHLGPDSMLPDPPDQQELWPCFVRWIQVGPRDDLAQYAVDAVAEIYETPRFDALFPGEIVLLTSTKDMGKKCVAEIQRRPDLPKVQDTFVDKSDVCTRGDDYLSCEIKVQQLERLKKMAFVASLDKIRVTTIKSFKGWEARAIVVAIEPGTDTEHLREIYVALTRVKCDRNGSHVSVVCSEPSLRSCERDWNFNYP